MHLGASCRRKNTVKECQVIHGGTDENNVPTFDGMWYTLVNEAMPQRLTAYLNDSKKITKKVIGHVIQERVKQFEESKENIARSVKVLYSEGFLSKEKYKDITLNLSMVSNKKKGRVSHKILDNIKIPNV